MAGITASTNLTELIPEITLESQFIYQNKAIGPQLVEVQDRNGLPGLTVEFPRFTEVTGSTGVAETGTPTSHQMDISMPTLTMARRSVYVILGDVVKKASAQQVVSKIGKAMGMAKAKQDDAAIFSVVTATTNWTTGTGVTNGDMAFGYILDGILLLEKNEVDEQLFGVFHPHQYDNIRDVLTPVANDDPIAIAQATEMVRNAFVSRMFGVQWFVTNRIGSGTVTSTGDVYNGLLFARSGVGYAWSWLETPNIEINRDAPGAQSGMVLNYIDSAGVIYASGVCKLYSTSA